jgi:hypothetical protein
MQPLKPALRMAFAGFFIVQAASSKQSHASLRFCRYIPQGTATKTRYRHGQQSWH